jgi:hypothetical protein
MDQRWFGPRGIVIGVSAAERPLAPTTPTHLEPLLGIEPAELLVVQLGAFPTEQNV